MLHSSHAGLVLWLLSPASSGHMIQYRGMVWCRDPPREGGLSSSRSAAACRERNLRRLRQSPRRLVAMNRARVKPAMSFGSSRCRTVLRGARLREVEGGWCWATPLDPKSLAPVNMPENITLVPADSLESTEMYSIRWGSWLRDGPWSLGECQQCAQVSSCSPPRSATKQELLESSCPKP